MLNAEAVAEHVGREALQVPPSIEELASRYKGRAVLIAGNGPSASRDLSPFGLPIWTINGGWVLHRSCDLTFMMDDLDGPAWDNVRMLTSEGMRDMERKEWESILRRCPVPIVTPRALPAFPQSVAYPLAEVAFDHGRPYYAETVCYAVAWAIHIGVKAIAFAGCDYTQVRPAERAGLEYWIGRAEEAGIEVSVLPGSTLLSTGPLDGVNRHVPGFYGILELPDGLRGKGYELGNLPQVFSGEEHASEAMAALLAAEGIHTVLDIGSGPGLHARYMADAGKRVIGVDKVKGGGLYEPFNGGRSLLVEADYLSPDTTFAEPFDAIWCSHMLEHVDNPQAALRKMFSDLKDGGLLVLTVPPAQHALVGGHFTLWNGGMLLYHLVRAGFDCREAAVKQYGYNITVLVRKRAVPEGAVPSDANYDVDRLKDFLPSSLAWAAGSFNGDIHELNWPVL